MADTVVLQVTRYEPEDGGEPTTRRYEIPLRKDWTVLDGLNHIKDEIDGTLTYRWSCRMGICGSCGMNVDGEPKLACGTFLTDHAPGPIRVEPLANFPVLRDLVVDIDDFMTKLPVVMPWLVRPEDESEDGNGVDGKGPDAELLQTPGQLADYKQYSMCINCMLCYSACPVYGIEEHFLGPALIALAQRYNLDSRDDNAAARLDVLSMPQGVWGCTFVGECSRACPKGVDPAGAIQRAKLAAATHSLKSFLMPRGRR